MKVGGGCGLDLVGVCGCREGGGIAVHDDARGAGEGVDVAVYCG